MAPTFDVVGRTGGRTTEKLLLLGHQNGKKCGALDAHVSHVTLIVSAMQKISKEKLKDSKNIAVCFCLQGDSVILIDFSWI